MSTPKCRFGTNASFTGFITAPPTNLRLDLGRDGAVPATNICYLHAGLVVALQDSDLNAVPTKSLVGITTTGLSVNISSPVGAGGLDDGVEAANTWYHVYLIGDTAGIESLALILSLSASGPTLPAGYDVWRRLGTVRNDGSQSFLPGFNRNGITMYINRQELYAETIGGTKAWTLVSGFGTDPDTVVPPTSSRGLFCGYLESASSFSPQLMMKIGHPDVLGMAGDPGGILLVHHVYAESQSQNTAWCDMVGQDVALRITGGASASTRALYLNGYMETL